MPKRPNKYLQKLHTLKLASGKSTHAVKVTRAILFDSKVIFLSNLKKVECFLVSKKEYLPHLGVLVFAIIAGTSNIASAKKVDEYSRLASSDPATTNQIIKEVVDPYTPQIKGSQIYTTDTSLAINNGFIDKPQLVETKVTERADSKLASASTEQSNQNKTIKYNVANGDTLSSIGWRYGVKLASLKYVNDLSDVDTIKPGQTLKIPPVGYEVSAKKIAEKDKKLALASRSTITRSSSSSRSTSTKVKRTGAGFSSGGKYVAGNCTSYAYDVTGIDPGGNGGQWFRNAQRKGLPTGSNPQVGAVFVTGESWAGHVGVVTAVYGDGSFQTSEMNLEGYGIVSSRTLSSDYVKGFIY